MRLLGNRALRTALLAYLVTSGCLSDASRRQPSPTPPAPGRMPVASTQTQRATFANAVAFYERGALEQARPLFRTLLDAYPALADYTLAYLAAIEDRTGHAQEASVLDDRLLAYHPASVWIPTALARRARIALALGDPRAAELAERTLAATETDVDARGTALSVQAALRATTSPREAYELYQAVRRDGGEAAPHARQACSDLERAHPELLADPTLLVAEGRVLTIEGRTDLALRRLETAAATASGDTRSEALRALAKAYQQDGRIEDAIAKYRAAATSEPLGGMARFDLASLLWNRDRDAEARALFTQIAAEAPRHPKYETACYALGRIAEQEGKSEEAATQFRRLAADGGDSDLAREARWRLAWMPYRRGDLIAAGDAFDALGAGSDKDRVAALYWRGRILARRGSAAESQQLFAAVLTEAADGYYGDLAERFLTAAPPPPPGAPTPLAGTVPPSLTMREYHWSRSVELRALRMNGAATRELAALARELPDGGAHEPFLLEAYTDVDAYGRALRLAQRVGASDATPETLAAYSFPRAFWAEVSTAATRERLDPYVVLALIRQESAFDTVAVSPAAAYGLMQLLMSTASRMTDQQLDRAALFDPATNIALGTRYLRQLLDRYQGNLPKALAAYNGGEEAVAKWERRDPGLESDEFVETISYRETRNYVKQVLGNYRRYRRLYGAPGEQRALEQSEREPYESFWRSSAATSLPPSPPNPPFDINTTTSPDAT